MRIGFACQYLHPDRSLTKKELEAIEKPMRMRTTTVRWCSENSDWQDRLWEIMEHNIASMYNLVSMVKTFPEISRMVRIGSDALPLFTHEKFEHFYRRPDVVAYLENNLKGFREHAADVRVSFHPAQFCVLASENSNTVESSIKEFEYHTYLAYLMGYARKFQDFKCNVHLSGKGGHDQFRKTFKRLSVEARKIITIENDEYSADLENVLGISDLCPIVMDIHHHWISDLKYLEPSNPLVKRVVESWRGVRPVLHYAYSRAEYLPRLNSRPDFSKLGRTKGELRQHSDEFPNPVANRWALSFLPDFDIMCEAKFKNLASSQLVDLYTRLTDK